MKNRLKNEWSNWTTFEKIWLATFTLVTFYLFFAWEDTVIGLITSLTGMLCVVLVAKGKISNYYFGLINVVLYAYLAHKQGLMGEFQLNAFFYLPMQFIGFYLWNKKQNKVDDEGIQSVKVKVFKLKDWLITIVLVIAGVLAYGTYLENSGGTQAYLDATTTVLAVTAQILMAKRFAEQWIVWMVLNVLSIVLWTKAFLTTGNDVTMLAMWSAYLVNSIYGYINWRKMFKQ